MNQPDLGKKISELRLKMGLTQSELAEKCNVSLRTIQRIEAAEVTPRSYTVKTIFTHLDYPVYSAAGKIEDYIPDDEPWYLKFYNLILDLFNLKTHTMKKVTILSVVFFAVIFGISTAFTSAYAQSDAKVKKVIQDNNVNYVKWFNSGDIKSLTSLYHDDACVLSKGCGKDFITKHFTMEAASYKLVEMKAVNISVSDTIAVEKGLWKIAAGEHIAEGEYIVEWRLTDKRWLIMSESTAISKIENEKL